MTEYCRESENLTVYHIHAHKCPLKQDAKIYRKQVRDAVLRNRGIGVQGIQHTEVGQAVANSDIWEAWRRAMQLSYANIRSEKAKISWKRNLDKHSLEAVGILKQAMDKEHKYPIYQINNPQFNRSPDYIFKSSVPMAQLTIGMDQESLEHPLQGEEAYFDGCHSRCSGYRTLALFVYHTAMFHILRLATIEVKSKSTCEITIFWELFNEILSDIKGRDYKFNLRAIMVDENSANYCAIRKVFGFDFVTSKVVSCQMHYKNDVNRASFSISNSYRDLFKNICHKLCSISTVGKYEKKKWLDEIATIFLDITSWINWWDARKYHMFPTFRLFGYSNVTLAESCNSMLK